MQDLEDSQSGIGGQLRAVELWAGLRVLSDVMEDAGVKIVGICERDEVLLELARSRQPEAMTQSDFYELQWESW